MMFSFVRRDVRSLHAARLEAQARYDAWLKAKSQWRCLWLEPFRQLRIVKVMQRGPVITETDKRQCSLKGVPWPSRLCRYSVPPEAQDAS
jgi:hypothetical protein